LKKEEKMQARPFFTESRKIKILATTTFVLKWTVILGAAQAFATLLIFTTFINNYHYFRQGAQGDVSRLCAPYLQSLQKH
jgi:hypothetical protein